jgi:ATP-dependent RNA helicase RhlE
MLFAELRLAEPILRALVTEGYLTATPVQAAAIPHALSGKDVLACAQTGTGKTAAFALPILHRLAQNTKPDVKIHKARCLVLAPTRELATQIATGFRTYGKHLGLRSTVIFGGVNQNPQADALRRGVDIIVATPGRLLDLMNQGLVDLRNVEAFVLDEADRMLDMGFIHDIRRIAQQVPAQRQTLLFSATMPTEIRRLAESLMRDPVTVQIAPVAVTADLIDQSVYHVEKRNKPQLLAHLVVSLPMYRTIVFTRTKHGADRVVRHLHSRGIKAEAIHGNKTQNARQRALDNFRGNKIPVLVATDIASRGIDVDGVTHIVNYDLTHEPETYVHRIGRTGRAGAKGAAIAFCDRDEMQNLKAIERLLRKTIPVKNDHPTYIAEPASDRQGDHRPNDGGRPPRPGFGSAPQRQQQGGQSGQGGQGGQGNRENRPQQPRREPQHPTGGGVRPRHPAADGSHQRPGGRPGGANRGRKPAFQKSR